LLDESSESNAPLDRTRCTGHFGGGIWLTGPGLSAADAVLGDVHRPSEGSTLAADFDDGGPRSGAFTVSSRWKQAAPWPRSVFRGGDVAGRRLFAELASRGFTVEGDVFAAQSTWVANRAVDCRFLDIDCEVFLGVSSPNVSRPTQNNHAGHLSTRTTFSLSL